MTAAGWYYYQGDPANTNRYWDGAQWVGEPVVGEPETAGGFDLIPPKEAPANQFYGAAAQGSVPQASAASAAQGQVDPGYGAFDIVHGDQTEIRAQRAAATAAAAAAVQPPTPMVFETALQRMIGTITIVKVGPLAVFFVLLLNLADTIGDRISGPAEELLEAGLIRGTLLAIGLALLLGSQLYGSFKKQPLLVLIPAAIMTLMDIALLIIFAAFGWFSEPFLAFFSLLVFLFIALPQGLIAVWSGSLLLQKRAEARYRREQQELQDPQQPVAQQPPAQTIAQQQMPDQPQQF